MGTATIAWRADRGDGGASPGFGTANKSADRRDLDLGCTLHLSLGFEPHTCLNLTGKSALGMPHRDQRLVDFGKAWPDRVVVKV